MNKLTLSRIYQWSLIMRILLLGMLCVIIFYLGFLFDLSDLGSQLQTSKEKEQNLKTELKATLKKHSKLDNEIAAYGPLPTTLLQWQNKLISAPALPDLMNEILKIGTTQHLQFILFTPGSTIKSDIYKMIPLKLIVNGEYDQIAGFLSDIANLKLMVAIGDFTISKPLNETNKSEPTEQNTNLLTADITLEVYYLAEKK